MLKQWKKIIIIFSLRNWEEGCTCCHYPYFLCCPLWRVNLLMKCPCQADLWVPPCIFQCKTLPQCSSFWDWTGITRNLILLCCEPRSPMIFIQFANEGNTWKKNTRNPEQNKVWNNISNSDSILSNTMECAALKSNSKQ